MLINGKTGQLKNHLNHFTLKDIEELLNKTNQYSSINAIKLTKQNKNASISKMIFKAFWTFFKMYVLRIGFMDGWAGFMISLNHAEGTFYKYAKILEIQNKLN